MAKNQLTLQMINNFDDLFAFKYFRQMKFAPFVGISSAHDVVKIHQQSHRHRILEWEPLPVTPLIPRRNDNGQRSRTAAVNCAWGGRHDPPAARTHASRGAIARISISRSADPTEAARCVQTERGRGTDGGRTEEGGRRGGLRVTLCGRRRTRAALCPLCRGAGPLSAGSVINEEEARVGAGFGGRSAAFGAVVSTVTPTSPAALAARFPRLVRQPAAVGGRGAPANMSLSGDLITARHEAGH